MRIQRNIDFEIKHGALEDVPAEFEVTWFQDHFRRYDCDVVIDQITLEKHVISVDQIGQLLTDEQIFKIEEKVYEDLIREEAA